MCVCRPPFKINDWSKWFTNLIFIVLSLASLMRPGWYQDLCVQPPYHDQQQASQCLLYNTSYYRSESSKIYFTLQAQEYEISDQIPYTLVKNNLFSGNLTKQGSKVRINTDYGKQTPNYFTSKIPCWTPLIARDATKPFNNNLLSLNLKYTAQSIQQIPNNISKFLRWHKW